jgi:hypothetical protein
LLQVSLSLSYRSTIVYITWRSTEGRSEKERLANFGKSLQNWTENARLALILFLQFLSLSFTIMELMLFTCARSIHIYLTLPINIKTQKNTYMDNGRNTLQLTPITAALKIYKHWQKIIKASLAFSVQFWTDIFRSWQVSLSRSAPPYYVM